jgi:hypothetical protein
LQGRTAQENPRYSMLYYLDIEQNLNPDGTQTSDTIIDPTTQTKISLTELW